MPSDDEGTGGSERIVPSSSSDGEAFLEKITQSISASIYEGRYENGRRYHTYREGSYPLPEDEREQDRLDLIQHWFGLVLKGELHRAPVRDPQRVLDVGTGTGLWALDFSDAHPDAQVIGTFISFSLSSFTFSVPCFIVHGKKKLGDGRPIVVSRRGEFRSDFGISTAKWSGKADVHEREHLARSRCADVSCCRHRFERHPTGMVCGVAFRTAIISLM